MNAHANVELLHQRLDDVELGGVLGGDAVEVELLGELENLAPFRRVLAADDAKVDSLDAMLLELGLNLRDDFVGGVMVQNHHRLDLRLVGREALSREEFDDLAAGFGGLLDGFHDGEAIERVGLAAYGESVLFELVWNRRGVQGQVPCGNHRGCGDNEGVFGEVHKMCVWVDGTRNGWQCQAVWHRTDRGRLAGLVSADCVWPGDCPVASASRPR